MSYIEENLRTGEQIIHKAKIHWVVFLPAILLGVLCLYAYSQIEDEVGLLSGVFAAYFFLRALLRKLGAEYALTNKRLIFKSGVLSRSALELMLTKCEGVAVDQGILGRILGYGSILVTTGGATNRFKTIKDPVTFRRLINEQIDTIQGVQ